MIPGAGCALPFRIGGGGWLLATMAMPVAAGLLWCGQRFLARAFDQALEPEARRVGGAARQAVLRVLARLGTGRLSRADRRLSAPRLLVWCTLCWIGESVGLLLMAALSPRGAAAFPAIFALLLLMPPGMVVALRLLRWLRAPTGFPGSVVDVVALSQVAVLCCWVWLMATAQLLRPLGRLIDLLVRVVAPT